MLLEQNTGVGIDALDALTSGDKNTAVGYAAGGSNNLVQIILQWVIWLLKILLQDKITYSWSNR